MTLLHIPVELCTAAIFIFVLAASYFIINAGKPEEDKSKEPHPVYMGIKGSLGHLEEELNWFILAGSITSYLIIPEDGNRVHIQITYWDRVERGNVAKELQEYLDAHVKPLGVVFDYLFVPIK
jgi:hypothetical protein